MPMTDTLAHSSVPDGGIPNVGEWNLTADKTQFQMVCHMCRPACLTRLPVLGTPQVLLVCVGCQRAQLVTLDGWPIPETP